MLIVFYVVFVDGNGTIEKVGFKRARLYHYDFYAQWIYFFSEAVRKAFDRTL